MKTPLKLILMSSLLALSAQLATAEQTAPFNFNPQQNMGWNGNGGQEPIMWGDCVPVPVMPVEFPQMQNNMQAPFPMRGAMPIQGSMPMMAPNQQPYILPPPSPFFNTPELIPMPSVPAFQNIPIPAPVQQPVCDNSSELNLQVLQTRYKQAAAASKAKITELKLALDDAQIQMRDASGIVENLSKQQVAAVQKIKDLEAQIKNLEDSKMSLQAELTKAASYATDQNRKMAALSRSTKEFTALKGVYKERNEEATKLKKMLEELNLKISTLQTASTLKSAQDNDVITSLKKQLADFDNSNKTLKSKISMTEASIAAQARKLTVLDQSSNELNALKSAYKERSTENVVLKEMLADYKVKFDSLQTASTLKGAQDNDLITALKKKLADLDNTNKTLRSQLMTAQASAGSQARKLTALGQSSTELAGLKSAYRACSDESAVLKQEAISYADKIKSLRAACTLKGTQDNNIIEELEKKLAKSENDTKSLLARITTLESTTSEQLRKVTALSLTAKEFTALKSAYNNLNAKKLEVDAKLAAATADSDKDGVFDIVDRCLTSPSGSKVNSLGCPADSDNDGVVDTIDKCPASPIGSAVDTLGCPADTDNDGVLNYTDQCPESPAGSEVNVLGCPADKDFDGVTDSKDACPSSPVGSKVNARGCPDVIDTDGDKIADVNDLCPNTVSGSIVNEFGCTATENITLKGVNFATGSARLTESSLPIIVSAAATIKKASNLVIEVAGYTDNQGGINANQRLSQRRANTVMLKLIENGVNAEQLTAKGYGVENPVATNATAEGRATNRRVELRIR